MKPVRITHEELLALDPCRPKSRLKLFGRRKYLTASTALANGASVSDVLWVAGRLGLKEQCVRFGLECAKRVSHLNPDPRVQAALDATQAWLDDPSPENAKAAADAAADAADAAEAADAADAAAWAADAAAAAWAADAATYAAAYAAAWAAAWAAARAADVAADAAADAAYAARAAYAAARAAAARAAEIEAQKQLLCEIFG